MWLIHPFIARALTGIPNAPIFSVILSLNDWVTLKISVLCKSHSRLPLVQLKFQMEAELSLFSVALFTSTCKISHFTWKENSITMAKNGSSACGWAVQHSHHCLICSSTQPGDSTSLLRDDLRAISSYSQSSPWQHPAHPHREYVFIRNPGSPSSPTPRMSPGLTANWKVTHAGCFHLVSTEFFFL